MMIKMSEREDIEAILSQAKEQEKTYDWMNTKDLYENALKASLRIEDFLIAGEINERMGHCLRRAAFQAGTREEFKNRIQQAIEAYEGAYGSYERLTDEQMAARMLRCQAVARYLGYWLASGSTEKGRLLDECLELEERALTAFWKEGDKFEYGRTYNELSQVFWDRGYRGWDIERKDKVVNKGIEWGERAVTSFSEVGDHHEIARANFALATCYHLSRLCFVADPNEQEDYRMKLVKKSRDAIEYSESAGDAYLAGQSHFWLGLETGGEESAGHFMKVLECGEKTRDNFLKAMGLSLLACGIYWKALATEDPDMRKKTARQALAFYDKAEHLCSIMSLQDPRGAEMASIIAPPGGYAEHYYYAAVLDETDPMKRLELLDRSIEVGTKALEVAEKSDFPPWIGCTLHVFSKVLETRASVEPDIDKKKSLLEKALKHRKRVIEGVVERLTPVSHWNLGVCHCYLAETKARFANIESDLNSKIGYLEGAASNWEIGLEKCGKGLLFFERVGNFTPFAMLQRYQDTYAATLTHFHDLTKKAEHLKKAMEISKRSIVSAKKLGMISRMAESYWKIAKAHATLGEHREAAENFDYAAGSYKKAAEKIKQLKEFYQDYSYYMQAWSEFEKAKLSHGEKRYTLAKEHYVKAAKLHSSTERWRYLAPNYLAWARIEEAEDLSRRDETEGAMEFFQQATKLFEETKATIEMNLDDIEAREEKEMLINLAQASDIRRDYCLGRVALEEAKILDRKGDHLESSRKYRSAAETFDNLAGTSEETRVELQPLVCLCQAWQKMTRAEAEASSDLYLEASQLFEEAKDYALDERSKRLALGHSRFCRALEAGTRFEDTRDISYYSEAIRHLGSASSHYMRAGFKGVSDYAEATHRLFDAYVYMDRANNETDPEKKARFYMMAERVLETSAGSYLTAKHPEKSKEVERLLKMVREKRELALSLSEVIHAPTIISTTEVFTAPMPTREEAVGLERFESADIQANLILGGREVRVGEDIDLDIELVNAGRGSAQLMKVEKVIPEGFEVRSVPDICRIEDSYLNMKGRTLSPLKTEELRLVIKPLNMGTFQLRPRVLYLDEAGKHRAHEPEPATVVVKEMGIRGWLRGPTR
ncbi:MAG: hypothetical protein JSV18_00570 [Candidatus Bathyarchaeota archaeon]|nr:MAG: hypothetical protein JSV18_00570 [Candidatus Bathyarchaeota archaeon]